ncbi:hypothetical protein SNE40_012361 [Patella caerulea]|uniref:F-box domain-containing protein n=1 Tax=Patella caerulea TaxID=87958 RepID=A0AAN8Q0U2_PATCE
MAAPGTSLSDCSCKEPVDCKDEDLPPLLLNNLPAELLIYISDFIDAKTIIKCLMNVCQEFYDLFSCDSYWKQRISKRWPQKYPAVHVDDFDWKEGCIVREETHRKWSNPDDHLDYFTYNEGLFAAVDTVHLMKNGSILAAGSRDRYLTILDLDKYDKHRPESKKEMTVYSDCKVHKGWIWSLASVDSTLATGSWDTFIRLWNIEAGCQPITEFKCKSAILSIHMEPGLIVAGGYDKKLYFIDPREGKKSFKRFHRQPVLCVAADDNYIITGSEDKTISIYDRRTSSVYKTVKLENCYALDLSYGDNQLWFGDKEGQLHLMDATYGNFTTVAKYDVGHKDKLTGVKHTRGAVFTSSSDFHVNVLEPNLNPSPITTLKKHNGDVTGISYLNGILATSSCDISIGIWRPKSY